MSKFQSVLTAVLCCFFIFCIAIVADDAAEFVAILIFLLVPVTAGYVFLRVSTYLIYALMHVAGFFPVPANKAQPAKRKAVPIVQAVRNAGHITNVMQRSEIMAIPAYARKETGFHYPMTSDILNGVVSIPQR